MDMSFNEWGEWNEMSLHMRRLHFKVNVIDITIIKWLQLTDWTVHCDLYINHYSLD